MRAGGPQSRLIRRLLATSSVVALVAGAGAPPAMAACKAVTAAFTNPAGTTISCITVTNVSNFSGGITNAGKINSATMTDIKVMHDSTFSGGISNSGTIGVAVNIFVNMVSTFSGGISNSGTLSSHGSAISVTTVSNFSGGISNSGALSGRTNAILVSSVSTFAGGISNSGMVSARSSGIAVQTISTFAGGINNSGTISVGASNTGISVGMVSNFSGGISNSGTISAGDVGISVTSVSTFSGGISNSASGTISGKTGILVSRVSLLGGITNAGVITGSGGTAIDVSGALSPVTITEAGGTINGVIKFSANGDTLTGFGTLNGNLSTGNATISPTLAGTGVLQVNGTYTQSATGTLVTEVNPTSASQLVISKSATLAGTLKVVYDPGTYSVKTYTILTSSGLSGTFSTVSGTPPSSFSQAVNYTATNVQLALTGGPSVSAGGASASTGAPGSPSSTTSSSPIVVTTNSGILGTSSSAAEVLTFGADGTVLDYLNDCGFFDGCGGAPGSGRTNTALSGTTPIQLAFAGSSLAQLGQVAQQVLPEAVARYGGWIRGVGNFLSVRGQSGLPGYGSDAGGFLAGFDRGVSNELRLGVAAGYSRASLSQSGGNSGTIDTPRAMIYASYHPQGGVLLDGVAGYAHDGIATSRTVAALPATASESHGANEESFALQAGYAMPGGGLTFVPRAGLQYLHLGQAGFTETGASGFDLTGPATNTDSLQPVVSVTVFRSFTTESGMRVVPEVKLAYSHEVLSTAQTLALTTPAGSLVPTTAVTPERNTVTAGPELTASLGNELDAHIEYKFSLGIGRSTDHIVLAGLHWSF